ncbi:MAG: nidogen-like domain-containing protein [Myxococcales bacterium]|nr:nidogen-like domain-containing protein [Myxococcales bacterium]
MRVARWCPSAPLLVAILLAWPPAARAVPLLRGFGGPAGFGTGVLPPNDDGSSAPIDLTGAFPGGLRFFGGPYTQFWVNNNGNITFRGPVYTFTPMPFPIADQPMIAPFWGDVDTRGGGAPDRNGVYWHMEPGRLIVTWYRVGYFRIHDDLQNSFQLIITNALDCGLGDFDVEFRYERCEWTTGDASGGRMGFGGTPAQAGFDAGNRRDFVEIPGSRTMDILRLCETSNVGEPGIWRFSVRDGMVSCPDTGALCDAGGVGACAFGITQCEGRDVVCVNIGRPSTERCDGIDNDCDGTVDGDGLCPDPLHVCVRGVCVPPCFEGGCEADETCTPEGACVETACLDVTCPAGERCVGGVCVGGCEGVVCPHGQQCFAGRCTNLCAVLECGEDEVCENGACVKRCPCRRCPEGTTCLGDGTCEPEGCGLVVCDPGYYCDRGTCRDACEGARCPDGQHCVRGECVDVPVARPDAGPPGSPDGGLSGGDGAVVEDGGTGADAVVAPPRRRPPMRMTGCGCRVHAPASPGAALALVIGVLLGLGARCRLGSRRRG